MTFVRRQIELTFKLASGTFTATNAPTVSVTGLRVSASIVKNGNTDKGEAQLRIYGLLPSIMQQLSTYGAPPGTAVQNMVEISAGDTESGMALIATGTIVEAHADYSAQPDVAFNVDALTGYFDSVSPSPSTSINGPADVATLMQSLAKQMALTFENNGVVAKLNYPYLWGPAWVQAEEVAQAAGINWMHDGKTLAIWPKNGYRSDAPVMISSQTGMVGYPTFQQGGVVVKALLNPTLRFGARIQVQSSLPNASGTYVVYALAYELQSELPDGAWFMTIDALTPNFVPATS